MTAMRDSAWLRDPPRASLPRNEEGGL